MLKESSINTWVFHPVRSQTVPCHVKHLWCLLSTSGGGRCCHSQSHWMFFLCLKEDPAVRAGLQAGRMSEGAREREIQTLALSLLQSLSLLLLFTLWCASAWASSINCSLWVPQLFWVSQAPRCSPQTLTFLFQLHFPVWLSLLYLFLFFLCCSAGEQHQLYPG